MLLIVFLYHKLIFKNIHLKKIFFIFLFLTGFISGQAQLLSPEQFLGYKIGERYTPHYKVVDYFKAVAAAVPERVQLQQYGETYEHRPLYIAITSSPQNMTSLEGIRKNNLTLAHMLTEKSNVNNATPIVWLSYNVHGNEPSSTEAAMLSLHAFADAGNTAAQLWLQNTVVIIDPCLNPDGRERYVNWYTGMAGATANPKLFSREHNEPWPGGRVNHYNFDLNRDWAWQTQKESEQRIAKYQQWMPQVHVDFHEQGVDNPYYFAPAAEPYHQAITQWQRDFQLAIGKNNAKYFDAKGWLYFTKEIFDLFYPSYGDTYPLFNGAIGMTYEQGGGPRGGAAALTQEGDTLTLANRAMHHFTTSMSTVETSSRLANKLVQEFTNYFDEATAGKSATYKNYIIKSNAVNGQRIAALEKLLDKNKIIYTNGSGSGTGFNYFSGKQENFTVGNKDIIIPGAQPQAVLLRTLMEPQPRLSDSVTYDITAWALPYAYGLDTYASNSNLTLSSTSYTDTVASIPNNAYGYVIPWEGMGSAKTLAAILQEGIRVRFAEKAFTSNGKNFSAGSLIIIKNGNDKNATFLGTTLEAICYRNGAEIFPVQSGMVDKGLDFGSSAVHYLKAPRVAMLTGSGVNANAAGEIWSFFDTELQYPVTLVNASDFSRLPLSEIDVLIMPDGRYEFLSSEAQAETLKEWISKGGNVVALENAVAELSKQKWSSIKSKDGEKDGDKTDDKKTEDYALLQKYEQRERASLASYTPGAIYRVEADNSHPLMYGYPPFYYTLKMDDKVYNFIDDGWNVGVIKKEKQVAGFVGYELRNKLKDGFVFGVQDLGRGSVTYLTDNIIFRRFWENGKLMLCNAVFMVGK